MPRYSPSSEGLTPHGRVGASSTSKVLVEANDARTEVLLSVDDEAALVSLAFGSTAVLGEVAEKLEALTTIGKGNVAVTGEAGGPFTVEFKGALATQDVPELTADASGLEAEEEAEAAVTIQTTVPGGISVLFCEA